MNPHPEIIDSKKEIFVDFTKLVDTKQDVFFSDVVKQIKYIPLETTSEYLLGNKALILEPVENRYLQASMGKPLGCLFLVFFFVFNVWGHQCSQSTINRESVKRRK